ncbi:hypothetical protein HC928_01335 [bacterium]|nr:hypothetical protein [bacterium]
MPRPPPPPAPNEITLEAVAAIFAALDVPQNADYAPYLQSLGVSRFGDYTGTLVELRRDIKAAHARLANAPSASKPDVAPDNMPAEGATTQAHIVNAELKTTQHGKPYYTLSVLLPDGKTVKVPEFNNEQYIEALWMHSSGVWQPHPTATNPVSVTLARNGQYWRVVAAEPRKADAPVSPTDGLNMQEVGEIAF